MTEFDAAFDAIPFGTTRGRFMDTDWLVTKTALAGGKAQKLLARELAGTGYVSLNLYRLDGNRSLLRPCEMPEEAAVAFVTGVEIGT